MQSSLMSAIRRTADKAFPSPNGRGVKATPRALVNGAAIASLFCQIGAHSILPKASQPIFENERVILWSVGARPAERPLFREPRRLGLLVTLDDGAVRFIRGADAGRTDNLRRGILIELKEHGAARSVSPPGIPPAFPRDGAARLIDNDRVSVWDLTWTTGMRTALHFHDKDVVVIYLGTGTVRTIPVDGAPTATPRTFGEAVFLARGRTHIEECIDGPRRDIIVELK